jgi:phosphate:Na+ symporter
VPLPALPGDNQATLETLLNIVGGIALLLWGIRMVRTGITRSFGAALRRVLALSARSRFTALAAGFGVAAAIQSSTATAMIVAAFAGQGLIAGAAALAIMLGADVGTTIVVQLLSFDVHWLSPLLIAIGVFAFLGSDRNKQRNLARTAIGIGLVLLSLQLIMLASAPLRETEVISVLLQPLASEPLLAIVIFAALTWAAHSSVAIVLLIMSLAGMQVLSLQMAMIMVLGANLGSGLAAVGLTLRAAPAARRVTRGNLLMRTAGVLAVLPAVAYVAPYLTVFGDSPARVVASFHLAFNLALAVAFLPFVGLVQRLAVRLLPDSGEAEDGGQPRYLDASSLDIPAVALSCATRETLRMGDEVRRMLIATHEVFRTNDDGLRKDVERADDLLHEAIKLYMTRLTKEELDESESARAIEILSFTTNLEHIGDIIDKNLMELAAKKIKSQASFSNEGEEELASFHEKIVANLDLALNVFMSDDLELARRLLREKTAVRDLERSYVENHYARIRAGRPDSIESSSLHLDVLRDLKRINGHLTSVAYPILERAEELADSRLIEDADTSRDADWRVGERVGGTNPGTGSKV